MKICIAQTESVRGAVDKNIENHLAVINRVVDYDPDLIIFPELSITGYEPEIAKEHATTIDDEQFSPFQKIADERNVSIGVGMPTLGKIGINISMLIFQPRKERMIYTKKLLHEDELPHFTSGNNQPFLHLGGKKIALGICYETLQREHFLDAVKDGADIYIASVAKPDRGVDKAYVHFPSISREFEIPILMANCVGYCDNFMSDGQSSIWNEQGELLNKLDEKNQGMLLYDSENNKAVNIQFTNEI